MNNLVCSLLQVYLFAVFGRIILSWFPLSPSSPFASIYSFLYTVTEPVLGPLRRTLPPLGAFDLSPIVVIIGVQVLQGVVCR